MYFGANLSVPALPAAPEVVVKDPAVMLSYAYFLRNKYDRRVNYLRLKRIVRSRKCSSTT